MGDFGRCFSIHRNAVGAYAGNANMNAKKFVGTAISKWITTSLTKLHNTFQHAEGMNADLSGWRVGKVKTLQATFARAYKFAGTGLSSWDTASVITLRETFSSAGEMNADLSKWKVGKVGSLEKTFVSASKFTGTGLASWDITKVAVMTNTFLSATSLVSCNKRLVADAWKSNTFFVATTYDTDWATDTCVGLKQTDAQFKQVR